MSEFHRINDEVFADAFGLLPTGMDTLRARAMLLAIGLQESRFEHRVQIGGPAHGFWQFEQGGGCVGVMTHPSVSSTMRSVCKARGVPFSSQAIYDSIINDDVLACCAARLLLYTLPSALPDQNQRDEGWHQYTEAWRPGAPHRQTWDAFFNQAWNKVVS